MTRPPRLDRAGPGTAELGQWVSRQRWFAAKSANPRLAIVDTIPLADDPPLALALLEAALPNGHRELYQLIVVRAGGRWDLDALADPRAAAALARLLFDGARAARRASGCAGPSEGPDAASGSRGDSGEHGASAGTPSDHVRFRWRPDSGGAGRAVSALPEVRPLGAEQSNSSLLVDGQVVLKLFRRLHPGLNPELEMLRFLDDHGFMQVPRLDGWVELHSSRLDATLGVATTYVSGARDGWELTLDTLATGDATAADDLIARVAALGSVTGAMHTVLGSEPDRPDFAPEASSGDAMASTIASTERRLDRLLGGSAAADVLGSQLLCLHQLREALQGFGRRVPSSGGPVMRTHGDLHLGQVLWTDGGWVVLDFEGEPVTPIEERRRKRSPLRDVAGMLRSFAYAASATRLQRGVDAPAGWEDAARAAYIDGYLAAVDRALLPARPDGWTEDLAIFELEKVVYELAYEVDNRPEWVEIPLAGIIRWLDEHRPR